MGTREAAKWYARRGWAIIPVWPLRNGVCACGANDPTKPGGCRDAGKHPIGTLIPNGIRSATTELETIDAWWSRYPDANVATTSFLRVDVDTRHDGKEHWRMITETMGDVPTVHCMTPSGGDHYYFRLPQGRTHGNAKGNLPSGIDIRGDGMGYTLLPPSNHLAGIYEWELSSRPDEVEIAMAPTWLLDLIEDDESRYTTIFSSQVGGRPDLSRWALPKVIEAMILDDRSRVDQGIIQALVRAGASDDDIRAVFRHYPTTGKYAEKRSQQDSYLALSISRARGFYGAGTLDAGEAHGLDAAAISAYRQGREAQRGMSTNGSAVNLA